MPSTEERSVYLEGQTVDSRDVRSGRYLDGDDYATVVEDDALDAQRPRANYRLQFVVCTVRDRETRSTTIHLIGHRHRVVVVAIATAVTRNKLVYYSATCI